METTTVTLPAYWCTALINNDYSGLDDQDPAEAARCRAVAAEYARDGWDFVDCEDEAHFTWNYDLYDHGADCRGGEVLEYTIIRR